MKFNTIKQPYEIEQISSKSLTNDLFILNKRFFVKKSKTICHKFLNLKGQIKIINAIKNEKFTLPILEAKFYRKNLIILMPNFPKLICLQQNNITDELLKEIYKLVKKLHEIHISEALPFWNPIKQLDTYLKLIKPKVFLLPLIKNLQKWLKTYRPKNLVLCHNDLTPNNFVSLDKKWFLIDWDFACINDPLFDIASFASETLILKKDFEQWIKLFELSVKEIEIVKKWVTYQNVIWYHWACYLYEKNSQDVRYLAIADDKLKRLKMADNYYSSSDYKS